MKLYTVIIKYNITKLFGSIVNNYTNFQVSANVFRTGLTNLESPSNFRQVR